MIRTQKQVKKDIQTFDDIIVSLKKQLKYVELSRQEMTKQLTIPVVIVSDFCKCKLEPYYFDDEFNRKCTKCDKHQK
tara:strand:- start:75 stop:305 length:231 start_codon:yes stop_codon:yes gene_type:complete